MFGALFGLNSTGSSSSGSYSSAPVTNTAPVQREYLCKYCDTKSVLTLKGGEAIVCPVCGAPVSQTDLDAMRDEAYEDFSMRAADILSAVRPKPRPGRIFLRIMILAALIISVYAAMHTPSDGIGGTTRSPAGESSTAQSLNGDSVYVPALSRTIYWNSQYECFYDKPTDCYFFYNEDIDPTDWQYWYEGISSDYGDCGWMEWDSIKEKWYINTSGDEWIVLPQKYDTSRLWHF